MKKAALKALRSWWACTAYLLLAVVAYDMAPSNWLKIPILIIGIIIYTIFSAIQSVKLVRSAQPLWFGTITSFKERQQTLKNAFASYFMLIVEFALFYLLISLDNKDTFNVPLDIWSALYFSTITIATVGYGDITPVEPATRFLVCLEIILGLIYTVFIFAMLANLRPDRTSTYET
jgi:hypothetical protein